MLKHVLLQPSSPEPIKWYEPSDNARNVLDQFPDFTFSHLEYESHAWPGGYEICYIVKDGGVLCHQCANKELMRTLDPDDDQFHVVDEFINWEDSDIYCDHCNRTLDSDDDQFHVVDEFINYEDSDLYCDHCGRRIEPACGEEEE